MKKVYDYHTGKLNESISLDKVSKGARKLNESAFDDILDSRELHNEKEIANIINVNMSRGGDPLVFWAYPGNDLLNTVQDICDDMNLACAVIGARDLMSTSIADIQDVDVIIINELTRAQKPVFNEAYNDIIAKAEEGKMIICVCRIDAAYNEMYAPDLLNFENYTYSPQYERQSKFIEPEYDDEEEAYESVTEKFAKYRKLYESDDEEPAEDDDPFAGLGDLPDANGEEGDDKDKEGDEGKEDSEDKGDKDSEEDDEYVPMTAIVLTVAKDDAEKCKDEMVEAGIDADAIEILDGEEDDENAKVRVDADYAKELKDYLSGKGIDLEEKIGGEIVDDSEEEEDKEKDEEEPKDDEEKKDDDEDIDFDTEFGDLFGDEEDSSDEA